MLLGRNFENIDLETLQNLVDAGVNESVHLDFKLTTYGGSDNDKKEFLKDISSFANSLGGHLVIGVREDAGVAAELVPLTGIDVDAELLRLESIARSGLEPPIVGMRMKRIATDLGDYIVVRVPRSYNPPHRVIIRNINRYFARNSSGGYELSLEELRMLFGQQRTIEDRAKSFVSERFLRLQANDGVLALPEDRAVLVMHLVPLPDFGSQRRLDVAEIREQAGSFGPIDGAGQTSRVNLDGFCVYRPGEICHGYTQIFRDGTIEATSAGVVRDREDGRFFPSGAVPPRIFNALSSYMSGLRALELSAPVLLKISFFRMRDVQLGLGPEYIDEAPQYLREDLHLPGMIISEFREDGNYQPVIAEQMNFLWNAFGFDRCFYFDGDGNWVPQ